MKKSYPTSKWAVFGESRQEKVLNFRFDKLVREWFQVFQDFLQIFEFCKIFWIARSSSQSPQTVNERVYTMR